MTGEVTPPDVQSAPGPIGSTPDGPVRDGLVRVVKINLIVLLAGSLFMIACSGVTQTDRMSHGMLMLMWTGLGIAVNFVLAVIFALGKHWRYLYGAILGALLFALIGSGLCFASLKMFQAAGFSSGWH